MPAVLIFSAYTSKVSDNEMQGEEIKSRLPLRSCFTRLLDRKGVEQDKHEVWKDLRESPLENFKFTYIQER